jgi:hypothetical protein
MTLRPVFSDGKFLVVGQKKVLLPGLSIKELVMISIGV